MIADKCPGRGRAEIDIIRCGTGGRSPRQLRGGYNTSCAISRTGRGYLGWQCNYRGITPDHPLSRAGSIFGINSPVISGVVRECAGIITRAGLIADKCPGRGRAEIDIIRCGTGGRSPRQLRGGYNTSCAISRTGRGYLGWQCNYRGITPDHPLSRAGSIFGINSPVISGVVRECAGIITRAGLIADKCPGRGRAEIDIITCCSAGRSPT